MSEFWIEPNEYLHTRTRAFYSLPYFGYKKPGNPDFLNSLKNTFNSLPQGELKAAVRELEAVLLEDLPRVRSLLGAKLLTVCVVPRAKAEESYHANQLLFSSTVSAVIRQLSGFEDGVKYLRRHSDTKTTHLRKANFPNDGAMPYPGITASTCEISPRVRGRTILLMDDIYTATVNIDEDAIQTLLDAGASGVAVYAVGKTEYRQGA